MSKYRFAVIMVEERFNASHVTYQKEKYITVSIMMKYFWKVLENKWNFRKFWKGAPGKTALEQVLERINIAKIITSICSTQN